MMAIGKALQARGEQVAFASQGGPYAHLLDDAGIAWTQLEPGSDSTHATAFLDALLSMGGTNQPLYAQDFLRRAVESEVRFFRRTHARMAVIGFNLVTYLSSRVFGLPLATSHGGVFVPPTMERRLCPAPVNPPNPKMSRLPMFLQRLLPNVMPPRLKAPVAFLNRVADELGVERVPSLAALMCGDLTMVTELPEVLGISKEELEAWRPSWGSNYRRSTRMRYTGPLFAKLDISIPPRVEAFLSMPGPCIYVAPTSVKSAYLKDLVRAARETGLRVLVASTIHDASDLEDDHTMVERILPNHLVMPRVNIAVIMGGQGSVSTAMASGTPFIGLPLQGEQELNVALAERQGVARRMSPTDASTPALTAAITSLMSDPLVSDNARRIRRLYEGVDGAAEAAKAIVEFRH
jgi:UDP:flavonoid glycosyltransferase YjiC (YdhE family)